jgi:hypothetical protein
VRQLALIINSAGTKSTVMINTVDPGLCYSELAREMSFTISLLHLWGTKEMASIFLYGRTARLV